MAYITNTKSDFGLIFNTFKGVVWINYNQFETNRPVSTKNETVDVHGLLNWG